LWRPRPVPVPAAEGYSLWADTYPPYPHNPLMAVEQSIVAPLMVACAPRVALGTGTGRNVPLLTAAGARTVVGLDLSQAMLRRHVSPARSVCANACALPFADARFDFVCSSLMAGDLGNLREWIHEAARVLMPGGHLVYSDFHPDWASHGWRRTFVAADGRTCELSYVSHPIDEQLAHCADASLVVRAIREPRVARKPSPVVVVFHLQKSSGGVLAWPNGARPSYRAPL
jgi:SAM-dependent methyltransferase